MRQYMKKNIRPVGLSLMAPVVGFFLLLILEMSLQIEVSRLVSSILNLFLVGLIAFVVFPRLLGIPFGRIELRTYLARLGFYLPDSYWKHIGFGMILAGCTLGGMLVASFLTGKYTMDLSAISITQVVFSLNPGIWEEFFYRGVMMILLIRLTRSIKRAVLYQVVLFGLMHIKGFDLWSWVDVLTVMVLAFGFTFAAWQTRSLVAGIVFHFFHDALLFFVQVPGDVPLDVGDNLLFYGFLWIMVGVSCLVIWLAANKLGIRAAEPLYKLPDLQVDHPA